MADFTYIVVQKFKTVAYQQKTDSKDSGAPQNAPIKMMLNEHLFVKQLLRFDTNKSTNQVIIYTSRIRFYGCYHG